MILPDYNTFKAIAQKSNVIPISKTINVDYDTPVSLFAKMEGGDYAFLLESLEGGEKFGRYSFIGLRPYMIFKSKRDEVWIETKGRVKHHIGDPIDILRETFFSFKPPNKLNELNNQFNLPRFFGGAVGFWAYDIVKIIEKRIPDTVLDNAGFYDIHLMVPELLLVYDNLRLELTIIFNCFIDSSIPLHDACNKDKDAGLFAIYDHGIRVIDGVVRRIRGGMPYPEPTIGPSSRITLEPDMTKQDFIRMVKRAKEYIHAGDCIQVVLSQRLSGENHIDTFHIYRTLRRINPSPYLFYLRLNDEALIGSSPEILVRLTGDEIYVRPIAGTRPRGKTDDEDLSLEKELLQDPKERAEHLMLVDLGRNDIGRVASLGSVSVDDFMTIERYSHVMHIVSGVKGCLAPDKDMFHCLEACFPAGTVSGAPKIRAMEIIEELEPVRRGPYAGAVGYLGFNGNMDLAITIRTLFQKGDRLYLQAGAGIVADSLPEREWEETINKAKALMRAVEMTGYET